MAATVVHRLVPASVEVTWSFLAHAPLIGEWLGDVSGLAAGEEFRLEFGDGDFVVGRMDEWCRPAAMRFHARFMDLPPDFIADYALRPFARNTFVTVREYGAATAAHARLRERHWTELLARLEARLRSGRSARAWSHSIEQAALLGASPDRIQRALDDEVWWRGTFPAATATDFSRSPDRSITATLREPSAASGLATTVTIHVEACENNSLVTVRHEGWNNLSDDGQRQQRRRFAESWARGLPRLAGATC